MNDDTKDATGPNETRTIIIDGDDMLAAFRENLAKIPPATADEVRATVARLKHEIKRAEFAQRFVAGTRTIVAAGSHVGKTRTIGEFRAPIPDAPMITCTYDLANPAPVRPNRATRRRLAKAARRRRA